METTPLVRPRRIPRRTKPRKDHQPHPNRTPKRQSVGRSPRRSLPSRGASYSCSRKEPYRHCLRRTLRTTLLSLPRTGSSHEHLRRDLEQDTTNKCRDEEARVNGFTNGPKHVHRYDQHNPPIRIDPCLCANLSRDQGPVQPWPASFRIDPIRPEPPSSLLLPHNEPIHRRTIPTLLVSNKHFSSPRHPRPTSDHCPLSNRSRPEPHQFSQFRQIRSPTP